MRDLTQVDSLAGHVDQSQLVTLPPFATERRRHVR